MKSLTKGSGSGVMRPQTGGVMRPQTGGRTGEQTGGQTGGQPDHQTDRQTGGQTGGQTGTRTYRVPALGRPFDLAQAATVLGVSSMLCFGVLVSGNYVRSVLGFDFRDGVHRLTFVMVLVVLLALAILAEKGHLPTKFLLKAAFANEVAQIAWALATVFGLILLPFGQSMAGGAYSVLSGWMMAAVLTEWNPRMAARRAGDSVVVVLSVLLAAGIFLTVIAGSGFEALSGNGGKLPGVAFATLPAISAICGVALRKTPVPLAQLAQSTQPAEPDVRTQTSAWRFFIRERIVFGVLFGLTMSAAVAHPSSPAQSVLPGASLLIGVGLIATVSVVIVRDATKYVRPYLVLCLPLVMTLTFLLVFDDGDRGGLAQLSVALTWLTWYIYTYSEMPVYREMLGRAPLMFGWVEKCATLLAIMPVSIAVGAVRKSLSPEVQGAFETVAIASLYVILVVFLIMIATLLYKRFPDSGGVVKKGLSEDEAIEALGTRGGLTDRERDVLRLLCYGYTRPRIMDALSISEGTAKTHIHRIYDKLCIQSHDELVDLFLAAKGVGQAG